MCQAGDVLIGALPGPQAHVEGVQGEIGAQAGGDLPADDHPAEHVEDEVVLSLWQEAAAVAEIGPIGRAEGAPPITLAHNVATASDVDRVLAEARDAGATVTAQAGERDWGGYSGYFADPDGFRWEIAYNPGPIGSSVL